MPLITIPIFDGGLITNADPEDIDKTAATESLNFEIDVPGKLKKRQGRDTGTTISGTHLTQLHRWSNPAEGTAKWLGYESQNTKLVTLSDSFVSTDISGGNLSSSATDVQILDMNNQVRFANGRDDKAGVFQYIDRQFFFGGWAPTAAHVYDSVTPRIPSSMTFTYGSISEVSTGSNGTGHYYYKFIPLFDGNQEGIVEGGRAYYNLTDANKTLKLPLTLDTGDFNKRITALKVYRSYNASDVAPVYQHIATIPTNSKSTHSDKESLTANVGFVLYDPDKSWTSATLYSPGEMDNEFVQFGGAGNYYQVDTTYSNYLTIKTGGTNPGPITSDGSGGALGYSIESDSTGSGTQSDSGSGFCGKRFLFNNAWTYSVGERNNWIADDGTSELHISSSDKRYFVVHADCSTGTAVSITATDGYAWTVSGTTVTLNFYDGGLTDGAYHPLDGKDKIIVNYKHAVYTGGRLFAGNVKLDPDGDAEVHKDWIIYSKLLQPDVLPIANYIQIQDMQGGEIRGMSSLMGDIVVFMERGVFRLGVPQSNPGSWSLEESLPNIGCKAPNSIIKIGDGIFFAGQEHAYVLGANFEASPLSEPIRDVYQGVSNIQNSRFVHEPKKNRLLCRFGDTKQYIYALDLARLAAGKLVWNKLDMGSDAVDIFAIDENLDVYTTENLA